MHDIPGLEPTAEAATQGAIAAACVTSVPTTDIVEHETPDNAAVDDDSGAAQPTGNESGEGEAAMKESTAEEEDDDVDDHENDNENDRSTAASHSLQPTR